MALTETWIKPEDTATPAALSTNFTFSTPFARLGGVEELVYSSQMNGNLSGCMNGK